MRTLAAPPAQLLRAFSRKVNPLPTDRRLRFP
jgi:hypothetical protein